MNIFVINEIARLYIITLMFTKNSCKFKSKIFRQAQLGMYVLMFYSFIYDISFKGSEMCWNVYKLLFY